MENLLLSPVVMVLIGIISVGRVARLVTHDTWPPMEWARPRLARMLGSWQELVVCPFCVAPYLMAVQMGWWALAHHDHALLWWWVVPNLWAAASYLAAILVAYDQPE